MAAAFTLRLMHLAGFGLDKAVLGIGHKVWHKMHFSPFNELVLEEYETHDLQKAVYVSRRFINKHFDRQLETASVLNFPHLPEPVLS